MSQFYVACELGRGLGRVFMGTLHNEQLIVSEIRQFENEPVQVKGALHWNIPALYHEVLEALRSAAAYEEPVHGISCTSWGGDYLLFEPDGSLITPTFEGRAFAPGGRVEKLLRELSWESVYAETGIQKSPGTTLCQLAEESGKRLKRVGHLLPLADGFNYLLSGVPRIELSLASATQLFNPIERTWSQRLLQALRLPAKFFPEVVVSGDVLGPLRPEVVKETKLEEAQVIAACSYAPAAMLAGLPVEPGEPWGYLRLTQEPLLGVPLAEPLVNDASRELGFNNYLGFGGAVAFHKSTPGLGILEACQDYWEKESRQLDADLLTHLAGSATPFASLINPVDPRFVAPEDMPLKIQAFCTETHQLIPRKPGPVFRCILESLALYYRKSLAELEHLTGTHLARLFVLGGSGNPLLNNFIANAVQVPVVTAPAESCAIGNIAVQAVALGHLESIPHARQVVHASFKTETFLPHAAAWDNAYERFLDICEPAAAAPAAAEASTAA